MYLAFLKAVNLLIGVKVTLLENICVESLWRTAGINNREVLDGLMKS